MNVYPTADLCDKYGDQVQVADPVFSNFGGRTDFSGPMSTVKCFADNSLVRTALEEAGAGRVLVVDGGGSSRCALLGGNLARLALKHAWAGILVYGCVRDSREIATLSIGVKALAAHPRKSDKHGRGHRDGAVRFAGVGFAAGGWLYADFDGVVVSASELSL